MIRSGKPNYYLKKLPPELLAKLRSGNESINGAYSKFSQEQRRHEITIKAASKAITSKANCNDRFQLINTDFRRVKVIKDNSVDLIFTDPPYAQDDLSIYSDLAKFANKTLVENGSLITYAGQYALLDIGTRIVSSAPDLKWWWELSIIHGGPHATMYQRRYMSKGNPYCGS